MSEQIFLKSTPLQDIRESGTLGRPLHTIYDQLKIGIEERGGHDLSSLLAEPVMNQEEGIIDWYTFGSNHQSLQDLPPAEYQKATAALHDRYLQLEQLAKEISASEDLTDRQLGEALLAALVVPADANVYWVDGIPVVTLWGFFQCAGDLAGWHQAFNGIVTSTPLSPTPPPPQEPVVTITPVTPPSPVENAGKYVVIGSRFFWSVFFLALLLLLLIFIFSFFNKRGSNQPSPSSTTNKELTAAQGKETQLRERLNNLRNQIEKQRADCPVENSEISGRSTNENEKKAFDQRMKKEQAKTGEITVTLKWNNRNDLDLYVFCPNNENIFYKNSNGCNGTLDVDKNYAKGLTNTPMENINWQQGEAMPGTYQIKVHYYKRQDMKVEPATPFEIRLRQGDKDTIYKGTLEPNKWKLIAPFKVTQ